MAKEYIEREASLNESICRRCFHSYVCEQFNEHRNSDNQKCHFFNDHFVPAADVVEVVHGRWTLNKDGSGTCNRCHFTQKNVWDMDNWQNFCGVCGARMDGEK